MSRMGDVLAGNHAVWEFDSDSVLIRFERGMSALRMPRLWHALGQRRIPHEALSEVSVTVTAGKRDTVVLRAAPRPGADPLMEAAAGQLKEICDPYRLVLPADRAPLATALADALRARLGPDAAEPAPRFLVEAPKPPTHLKAYDARATLDESGVGFRWSRTGASSAKWKAGDQHFPLATLTGVEWHSPEQPGGHLRLRSRDDGDEAPAPEHDPAAVLFALGYGGVHESLPFAAAVLAAVRGRTPVAAGPMAAPSPREPDRMRHLSELHGAGLLTDAEYAALRDRFATDV
ncbi:DUF4429 domain-containing protein [Streptomyces sp. G-G2]|uniref:DUF4429 domain-containing protein n=1 Tax=Streptomyces sp. G-G2 TaxID=3046201 RepID=UPI0024BAE595|nr:DUF4429 domain-containing protein [Streptomyces sp. G-G2]MDJ0383918.1 DUF4429 domain-containing protein [Streptomyces sp. G-G2]